MFTTFTTTTRREPKRMHENITPYLQLGDYFLGEDFMVIRIYGVGVDPHKLHKNLTHMILLL